MAENTLYDFKLTDSELANLPDDPQDAFIMFEAIVRIRYDKAFIELSNKEEETYLARRYMNVVLPAARHYGIPALAKWDRPKPIDELSVYRAFMDNVEYHVTALRLSRIENIRINSISLDADSKAKLRSLLNQIRETVDKLTISDAKKDRLYYRINALQDEIDRDRTNMAAFAQLFIEACDTVGEGAKRLDPVVSLMRRVGAVFRSANQLEEARRQLPPRAEPKKIEGPSRKTNGRKKDLQAQISAK